jgi:hypothetical protein
MIFFCSERREQTTQTSRGEGVAGLSQADARPLIVAGIPPCAAGLSEPGRTSRTGVSKGERESQGLLPGTPSSGFWSRRMRCTHAGSSNCGDRATADGRRMVSRAL